LLAIVGGFYASLVLSIQAFRDGNTTSGMVLGAIAIGCALLCYQTYVARDQLRT
jgi:ABC-type enterobactin transport system permease subunit